MAGLAEHLPAEITLASARAPIGAGDGYAWFANRGIGRPLEASIKDTARAIFGWLDGVASVHHQVVLLGFSGGTAMAGGLILSEPERFAGAVLLSGTLPWEAGLDSSAGRLQGVRVFWGNDEADSVIPRELMTRSERWLVDESGADLTVRHFPGLGHGIGREEIREVHAFVTEVLGSS